MSKKFDLFNKEVGFFLHQGDGLGLLCSKNWWSAFILCEQQGMAKSDFFLPWGFQASRRTEQNPQTPCHRPRNLPSYPTYFETPFVAYPETSDRPVCPHLPAHPCADQRLRIVESFRVSGSRNCRLYFHDMWPLRLGTTCETRIAPRGRLKGGETTA